MKKEGGVNVKKVLQYFDELDHESAAQTSIRPSKSAIFLESLPVSSGKLMTTGLFLKKTQASTPYTGNHWYFVHVKHPNLHSKEFS